jgi:hypothetical protein
MTFSGIEPATFRHVITYIRPNNYGTTQLYCRICCTPARFHVTCQPLAVLKLSHCGLWASEKGEAGMELGTVRSWQLPTLTTVWGRGLFGKLLSELTLIGQLALYLGCDHKQTNKQTTPCHIALLLFCTVQIYLFGQMATYCTFMYGYPD